MKKFAVIIKDSIHIPGDERSKTNPGHGYPEHLHEFLNFISFNNEDELKKWILNQESKHYDKKKYEIISYENVNISIKTEVIIN